MSMLIIAILGGLLAVLFLSVLYVIYSFLFHNKEMKDAINDLFNEWILKSE